MCSRFVKPNIKRELLEVDNDVVEIPPRRAVTPNGNGFAVKIRDTNELTEADIRFIKPFLRLPAIVPMAPARFTMKELPATGGWELLIEDTSTLTLMHMQSIVEIIESREREVRSTQGSGATPPQQHVPQAIAHARPGVDLTDLLNGQLAFAVSPKEQRRGRPPKNPNAPKRPSTAYAFWSNESRQRMKKPGMTSSQVNKAISEAWKEMSHDDRVPWQRLADEEKRRYARELAEFQKAKDAQKK